MIREQVNRCVDCGKPIKAPSQRCRVHAAAEARRVKQRLIESGEPRPETPVDAEAAILRLGIRLATEFASPVDARPRTTFYRINADTVVSFIEFSGGNWVRGRSFPLADHPTLAAIVASGKPRANVVRRRLTGPQARKVAPRRGVSASAGVPIARGGSLHGILAIELRVAELPDELFWRLIDLGRLLEFALANSHRPARWS